MKFGVMGDLTDAGYGMGARVLSDGIGFFIKYPTDLPDETSDEIWDHLQAIGELIYEYIRHRPEPAQ